MAESNMLKSIPDTGFNYSNAAAKCCPLKGNAVELNRGNMETCEGRGLTIRTKNFKPTNF